MSKEFYPVLQLGKASPSAHWWKTILVSCLWKRVCSDLFYVIKWLFVLTFSFSQSGYVGIHMRTHTGARPYICQTCGKAFAGSNTLAIHMRIHTGEKPYTCDTCGKSFSRHETLVIHTRSHTGLKPHVCAVCSKGFTSSGHLTGHMRTHTGVKPHACDLCGKRFLHQSLVISQFFEMIFFLDLLVRVAWRCTWKATRITKVSLASIAESTSSRPRFYSNTWLRCTHFWKLRMTP